MSFFPTDNMKLKARIRAYERALAKRNCDDGYGKRFLVGHMYLLLDDHDGALGYYDWYAKKFPDDGVEPLNHVTWALALYRAGRIEEAKGKLKEAALRNPHIWDWLHGGNMAPWDIEYGCNFDEPQYLLEAPPEILIRKELKGLRPGPRRTAVCESLFALHDSVRSKRPKARTLTVVK